MIEPGEATYTPFLANTETRPRPSAGVFIRA